MKAKTFREDLYYRLNVVRIRMPPLRDRAEDIPQIVDFCLQNLVKQRKARVSKVSPEAMAVLIRYPWPGNVRELENVIYRSAVVAQGDAILVKDLPAGDPGGPAAGGGGGGLRDRGPGTHAGARRSTSCSTSSAAGEDPLLASSSARWSQRALKADGRDVAAAAKRLGMTKAALQKKASLS